jgi:predicted LPLAT superfamily acyltransferase
MIMRHFAAFAEMMLDKMLLWSCEFDAGQVKYFGTDVMGELVRSQRGAVLMCSHLGNVDLCRVLSARHRALKMTILVHTKHAQMFNHLLATINSASQMNLLQVTEVSPATAIMLAERVAQGELVVIAGDRIPVSGNPRTVSADFFGESAPFPVGPYILASVLQCPLFMVFSMKKSAYEVHFSLLRESIRLPRKGRDEAMQELARDYAAALQQHCLEAPLQWFNFYDYWHLPDWEKIDESR